uniref:Uncharacterized protein n=1 Tax=Fagus sylvatica TaxID=28930 RepID=A0A2N9FBD6_FAGSY
MAVWGGVPGRFQGHMRCGDHPLKEAFPEFFWIVYKDALVADHLQAQTESIHWALDFTCPVQD